MTDDIPAVLPWLLTALVCVCYLWRWGEDAIDRRRLRRLWLENQRLKRGEFTWTELEELLRIERRMKA